MKRLFAALMIVAAPSVIHAQIPSSISIRTTEIIDTTVFTITWTRVSGYSTYDLNTFSAPRMFETEMFRIVTGNTWTIKVPRNRMSTGLKFYASVRVSMSPRYGAITYTLPPLQINGIDVKPDSIEVQASGTQQFCAFVRFIDGQLAMRNVEKDIPACQTEYTKLDSTVRRPSALQQREADTVSVTWSVQQVQ